MSKAFLADRPRDCNTELLISNGSNRINVLCTRSHGHPPTGHEFAGDIDGHHIHIIWGEPYDGETE
jgi:hypothetical protein